MSQRDAVLFANEAFYQAFSDRDFAAMQRLWSREHELICIHPGWPPVEGRMPVLETWRAILANPETKPVRCHQPLVVMREDMALVVCYEEIEGQFLIATNAYVHEDGIWRLVHHQAGPTNGRPEPEERPRRTVN